MRATEIIQLVKNIRAKLNWDNLNDPGVICNILDIPIRQITLNPKIYPAYTTNIFGKPVISLNVHYTMLSQLVLCAHELGHALLHADNYYNGFHGENPQQEYEANLFAVALLFTENQYELFNTPLEKMSNSELKCILDTNIKLTENGKLDYRYYPMHKYDEGDEMIKCLKKLLLT